MTIYPVPNMSMWLVHDHVRDLIFLPKDYVITKGRKRTKRIPSTGEHGRKKKSKKGTRTWTIPSTE